MTLGLSAQNSDLDNWFDLYITGAKAGNTGISVGGADLSSRYQALAAGGSQGPNTGITYGSGHADIAGLFAKKGTTSTNTPLPINGKAYSAGMIVSTGSGSIGYSFGVNASTWSVTLSRAGSTGSPAAGTQDSGATPSGAATCQISLSLTSGSAMTTTNNASSPLALASTPSCSINISGILQNNPGSQATYAVQVNFYNSGGTLISTTNFTWSPSWSGNV